MSLKLSSQVLRILSLPAIALVGIACSDSDGQPPPAGLPTTSTPYATRCLYGDPDLKIQGRALTITCPDGGEGGTFVCDYGPPRPRVLSDGRVVVVCQDDRAPPRPGGDDPKKRPE
jgi:hypothetical protein